jgi:hypothetical protein
MPCKVWGFQSGDYEKCLLLGYKNTVRTSQETHCVSATEPSRLKLCEIWEFHGGDYEEWRLLECYNVLLMYEPTFRKRNRLHHKGEKKHRFLQEPHGVTSRKTPKSCILQNVLWWYNCITSFQGRNCYGWMTRIYRPCQRQQLPHRVTWPWPRGVRDNESQGEVQSFASLQCQCEEALCVPSYTAARHGALYFRRSSYLSEHLNFTNVRNWVSVHVSRSMRHTNVRLRSWRAGSF